MAQYITRIIPILLSLTFAANVHTAPAAETAAGVEQGITRSPGTSALIKLAEAGDADAANTLAFQYGNGLSVMQNDVEALKWYRRAAQLGSVEAEYNLGSVYQNGYGVEQDDVQAVGWYRKAAEHGLAEAQNSLALMYEMGRGVKRDYAMAANWYRKAAAQGLTVSEKNLQSLIDRNLLPQ
ncbi:MAG: tetratricopeptide repeat protein [Gammaproteobacteria bacterium]